jgi:hypothetical protein
MFKFITGCHPKGDGPNPDHKLCANTVTLPLSHSGEAVTETDNSKSEIEYLILLASACYIDHIEKSINFNEFFVINQKKTFLIHLEE